MPNIHQELLIAASPEKIYDAITTPQGLSAWWTPGTTAKPELNSIVCVSLGVRDKDRFKNRNDDGGS